jgi:hypothetical protein
VTIKAIHVHVFFHPSSFCLDKAECLCFEDLPLPLLQKLCLLPSNPHGLCGAWLLPGVHQQLGPTATMETKTALEKYLFN